MQATGIGEFREWPDTGLVSIWGHQLKARQRRGNGTDLPRYLELCCLSLSSIRGAEMGSSGYTAPVRKLNKMGTTEPGTRKTVERQLVRRRDFSPE